MSGAAAPERTRRSGEVQSDLAATSRVPAHRCWADGRPCEVVAAVAGPLLAECRAGLRDGARVPDLYGVRDARKRWRESVAKAEGMLPCAWCRGAERAAKRLRGLRLGALERRVLLAAPGPESDEGAVVEPGRSGPSARWAVRRAALRLYDAGLVWIGWRTQKVATRLVSRGWGFASWGNPVKREYHRRAVWLSPLGAALAARVRDRLAAGRRVRWNGRARAALREVRKPASELVSVWLADVARRAGLTAQSLSIGAQIVRTAEGREILHDDMREWEALLRVKRAGAAVLPPAAPASGVENDAVR